MIETFKQTINRAFDLNIYSDVPLPELPTIIFDNAYVDVTIRIKDLTDVWTELSIPNKHYVVKENFVLFMVPDIGIFIVEKGRNIYVSPFEGTQEDQLRLYILGTCMGALLLQRKVLPLHGSAVVVAGNAYAIVGDSGAGKSTLASAFLSDGFQLLSDDVIPVNLLQGNIPMVSPAYAQQKLWIDSMNEFGIEHDRFRPLMNREKKFAVPVTNQFASTPMPLRGIFELIKTDSDGISIQPVENLYRLHTLYKHTFRNFLINRFGLMEWHFNTCASMVNNLSMYKLHRTTSRFTAYELKELILFTIYKGGRAHV